MIARFQAAWVGLLLVSIALWLVFAGRYSLGWALGGVAFGLLLYFGVMALQFGLMQHINRHDAAPRAQALQLLRAWWAEGWIAVRVFCWDQPFRSQAEADWLPATPTGERGVVLVHGFLCNRAVWRPWFAPLRRAGHAYEAVNLEPVLGSIDLYAPIIDAAVQRVQAATGMAPVLVCHSMGGLAARAWLRSCTAQAQARAHHIVTLGTPHRGTWAARFARSGNSAQMALASDWTVALARAQPGFPAAGFTCWYSNCDNVVFPASSASLPGAHNRLVAGLAHMQMARHPAVIQACIGALQST